MTDITSTDRLTVDIPGPARPTRANLSGPLMASAGRLAFRSPEPTEDPSCETRCENVLTPAPSALAS